MLQIWMIQSPAETEDFCRRLAEISGENLDASCVSTWRSDASPYEGYSLLRVLLQPQHVSRSRGDSVKIDSPCVSYVLRATKSDVGDKTFIPLRLGANEIYITNEVLGLKVTAANAERYSIFYGLLVSNNPRFTFLTKLSHAAALFSQQLSTSDAQDATVKLQAVFPVNNEDSLDLSIQEHKHFLLGKYTTLRLPTIYKGCIYLTKLRFTEAGLARMDSDEPLTIQGVSDPDEFLEYYNLDKPTSLESVYAKVERRLGLKTRLVVGTLFVDKLVHIWLLPLFLFNLLLLLIFGARDPAIYGYFERLQDSSFLTFLAAFFGVVGTAIAVFRYAFLEFAVYVKNVVPSSWEFVVDEMEKQSQGTKPRAAFLLLITLVELAILVGMALSLLVYGLTNLAAPVLSMPALNFGESIQYVALHVPGVESWLGVSPSKTLGLSSDNKVLAYVVSAMFTTVILGIVGRQLKLAVSNQTAT